MSDPTKGYLLIADITGYTRFLTGSELDHAKGILEQLFSALIEKLRLPFRLSNIQGDAILAHATAASIPDGAQVLDLAEALYCGFADALERMTLNTTCPCAACRNIANLDLKLFVHHGVFVEQAIAGRQEIQGSDVILIHRLMKNGIVKATGIRAYAAFTEAAIAAGGLAEYFSGPPRHREEDDDFGEIALGIVDLRPIWQQRKARRSVAVGENDERCFADLTVDLPLSPIKAWHHLTDPATRLTWVADAVKIDRNDTDRGRVAVGTVEHCAHGSGQVLQFTIVDWRPPETYTQYLAVAPDGWIPLTLTVSAIPAGSRIEARAGMPAATTPERTAELRAQLGPMGPIFRGAWEMGLRKLAEIAAHDADPAMPSTDAAALAASIKNAAGAAIAAN